MTQQEIYKYVALSFSALEDLAAARKATLRDYDARSNKLTRFMRQMSTTEHSEGDLVQIESSIAPEIQALLENPTHGL